MNTTTTQKSYLRVLHAVPDAPAVDVYINGSIIFKNLSFGQYTEYLPVLKGLYHIAIYPTGTMGNPALNQLLLLEENEKKTVAAVGMLSNIELMDIADANVTGVDGKAMVRFIHLSPNAPAVDIALPNGTILFRKVSYRQITPYIAVSPDSYTLLVKVAGTPDVVLTVPNVKLDANRFYSVYALGLVGKEPPLQALSVLDSLL